MPICCTTLFWTNQSWIVSIWFINPSPELAPRTHTIDFTGAPAERLLRQDPNNASVLERQNRENVDDYIPGVNRL